MATKKYADMILNKLTELITKCNISVKSKLIVMLTVILLSCIIATNLFYYIT